MDFYETELKSVELDVVLESTEFEGVRIGYYNFIRIVEAEHPLDDFGSGFELREDGIYLKLPPPNDRVWACLTEAERDVLTEHPKGKTGEPVLVFPFTLGELKIFLDWAANAGHELPINEDALLEVIQAQAAGRATIDDQGAQARSVSVRHKSVRQQRIEVIQLWFSSQCKYTKENLRPLKSEQGQPWARQDCWGWLCDRDFTSEGRLFGNAKQSDTAKSKTFIRAWSSFIKQD
jgi:hypothetical protein